MVSFNKPGYRAVYAVTIKEKVAANYQDLASGKPDTSKMPVKFSNHFENSYQFNLSITVLSLQEKSRLMQGQIDMQELVLKQDNQPDQRRAGVFRQAVTQPFYFKINAEGVIYNIQPAANSPAAYVNFLCDLLSQLQIVTPSVPTNTWTINQEYPDGIYQIRYMQVNNSFDKTIVGKGSADSVVAFENKVSRSALNLMASKVFFNKKFYQKLGSSILSYVEREIQLQLSNESTADEQPLIAAYNEKGRTISPINIYNPISEERRKMLVSQGVLKNDTYETLKAQLPLAATMESEQLNLLISKFRALCFLQPQHIPAIAQILLQAKPEEANFAILTAALIEVDTDSAQQVLAELIRKYANDWQVLQRILPALGLRKYLSVELEKELLNLRLKTNDPSIAGSAGLTISNLCRQLSEKQPQRADSIMGALVQHYQQQPKDKSTISRFLNETGNAGYAKASEENIKYLNDEDADTRLRAWYSLRLFKDQKIDTLLSTGLTKDTTVAMQQRILSVIHMRPVAPVYLDAVTQVLKSSTNAENIAIAKSWLEKYQARINQPVPSPHPQE